MNIGVICTNLNRDIARMDKFEASLVYVEQSSAIKWRNGDKK